MADPYKRLRHQIGRKKRRANYRQYREDSLQDIANHGLTHEPLGQDEVLKKISEWLNKPQ